MEFACEYQLLLEYPCLPPWGVVENKDQVVTTRNIAGDWYTHLKQDLIELRRANMFHGANCQSSGPATAAARCEIYCQFSDELVFWSREIERRIEPLPDDAANLLRVRARMLAKNAEQAISELKSASRGCDSEQPVRRTLHELARLAAAVNQPASSPRRVKLLWEYTRNWRRQASNGFWILPYKA
jgi:hypothetical protein